MHSEGDTGGGGAHRVRERVDVCEVAVAEKAVAGLRADDAVGCAEGGRVCGGRQWGSRISTDWSRGKGARARAERLAVQTRAGALRRTFDAA